MKKLNRSAYLKQWRKLHPGYSTAYKRARKARLALDPGGAQRMMFNFLVGFKYYERLKCM